jgi:hypothetical protein
MTRFPEHPQDDSDEVLPQRLQDALTSMYPTPRVPREVEARILNRAAATWAKQARFAWRLWWAGAGAAAAAAVAIVVLHMSGGKSDRAPLASNPPAPSSIAGDIDRNGRVDILDAFAVARQLRDAQGKPLPASLGADLNGDGIVDQKDVDLIAQMAVRIGSAPVARAENAGSHADAGGIVE